MIDPRTVLIATPTHDGRVEAGQAGALLALGAAHMVGSILYLIGNSEIRLARSLIVHSFLRSPFEWLVCLDSDITFSVEDFRLLMDYPPVGSALAVKESNPEGTTLTPDGHALIVAAEYARKVDSLEPARFGLGFTRIHRSVFDRLTGSVDAEGAPRVGYFRWKGEEYVDYFPNGPGFEGTWFGEDTGFFHLCRLCGIFPRVEQRTRLNHVGRRVYAYVPPGVGIATENLTK